MLEKRQEKQKERENGKSGQTLFLEAMEMVVSSYPCTPLETVLNGFEKSAKKGHKESLWIVNIVNSLAYNVFPSREILKTAFLNTVIINTCNNDDILTNARAWFWAAYLTNSLEETRIFMKMSSDSGYSWGQTGYAKIIGKNYMNSYFILLNKAASPQLYSGEDLNPEAHDLLGHYYTSTFYDDYVVGYAKAKYHFFVAANLGWKSAKERIAQMYYLGQWGIERDFIQAAKWSNRFARSIFKRIFYGEFYATKSIKPTPLWFELGKGFYWYGINECFEVLLESSTWLEEEGQRINAKQFSDLCVNYYCETIEMKQKSILLFLHFWNTKMGVKDIGKIIGQFVMIN